MNWIKEKIGMPWFISLCIFSAYSSYQIGWKGIIAFPLIIGYGILCILFTKWVRPSAIITNGGFFSLLWAKIFWNCLAPIMVMFFSLVILIEMFKPTPLNQAQSDVASFCGQEQIAKTGTQKCEKAKKALTTELQKILPSLKKSYKTSNNSIKKLEKETELKCSDKGLKDFGSQGCEEAKQSLEAEKTNANDLDKRIKELEQELSDITKK